jgi:septum formation topological specificity factor MinE
MFNNNTSYYQPAKLIEDRTLTDSTRNILNELNITTINLVKKYTEISNELENNKLNNVKTFSILEDKIETQQKQINELIKNQQIMNDKHIELVNKLLDRIVELSGKN